MLSTLLTRRALLSTLAGLAFAASSLAQSGASAPPPASREDLRALLQPILEAHRLPALGAAMIQDGIDPTSVEGASNLPYAVPI